MKHVFIIVLLWPSSLFAQWSMNPAVNTPVCTSPGRQIDLRMMEDGKGGAYVTWKDYRTLFTGPDIYVQRINSKGIRLWANNGIALCTDSTDQSTPNIISDMKGGVIVAWSDWRSNIERDLYAQRVDSNGNILWMVQGANITNLSQREHSEKLVSDGHGGVIVVFEKQVTVPTFHWEIWAQRLDSTGAKMWGLGGVSLSLSNTNKRNHKAQKDRNGGAIICWQDLDAVSNSYDIYAQRVNANGNLLWGPNGKAICNATGDQINAKIDPDSIANGAFIAWQDTRTATTTDYDIYIQRVDSNGNGKWTPNGNVVCNALANQSALDLMSVTTTNETMVTWKDNRNGNYDIYAQKLDLNGLAKWTSNGNIICNDAFDQINPNIVTDENKGAVIVWQDSLNGKWDVRAQRIDNNGNVKWAQNGEWVSTAIGEQSSPKNCSDGRGGSIFAWQDKRTDTFDIYMHHLFASGSPNAVKNVATKEAIYLYPNPTQEYIDVQSISSNPMQKVEVMGVAGNIIFSMEIKKQTSIRIPTREWPSGIYVVNIQLEGGVVTKKIRKD
jgi:Secretion system C-terminal sorting domain